MCGCRDLLVLENRIKLLFGGISLISSPHQVNLIEINMFMSHIVEFSKKNLEISDFVKMRKQSTSGENSCFMFFQAGRAPLMTSILHLNKCCA